MEVVDHEPGAWFLLREDQTYLLDVSCEVSAVGFSMLIQLTDDERADYDRMGRVYVQDLAARVRDRSADYAPRNLSGTRGASADEAIGTWRRGA